MSWGIPRLKEFLYRKFLNNTSDSLENSSWIPEYLWIPRVVTSTVLCLFIFIYFPLWIYWMPLISLCLPQNLATEVVNIHIYLCMYKSEMNCDNLIKSIFDKANYGLWVILAILEFAISSRICDPHIVRYRYMQSIAMRFGELQCSYVVMG